MPSTSSNQTSRKRRVRYDRILAVLLILILLIVLLVKCCSSCGKKEEKQEDPAVTTAATEATTEPSQMSYDGAVYLSPSNQQDNAYYLGDTNEAVVTREIAEKVKVILEQSGLTVVIADENASLEDKVAMGNSNAFAAYVAIHSNAGEGVGTDCYYNGNSAQSQALAQAVYDPVAALTPTADRGLIDGAQTGSDSRNYEVSDNNSPCCLIEMEFHDGPNVAQWILDNKDNLAQAIATGICNYLQVTPAGSASTSATDVSGTDSATTTVSQNAIQNQLSAGA